MAGQVEVLPHRRVWSCLRLLLLALVVLRAGASFAANPESPEAPGRLGRLLSSPLPGTLAHEDAEFATRLETTLAGFDGIESARAIVSGSEDRGDRSRAVVIQLVLADGFCPTQSWLDTIRVVTLRIVPGLDPNALTLVDSTGRILHDAGHTHLPAPAPAVPRQHGPIDETFHFEPWWLWMAGGVGFVLVVTGVCVQLFLRRDPGPAPEQREPGPLDFLQAVPDERIARTLAGERPEVIGAAMALMPEEQAERLRLLDSFPSDAPLPREQPDPAMAAALAEVLRERLVRT